MRNILFRGKAVNDSYGWVYGDLLHRDGALFIWDRTFSPDCMKDAEEVIPETVGQLLLWEEKSEKPIFEGDIVQYRTRNGFEGLGIVGFNTKFAVVEIFPLGLPLVFIEEIEKIGNKWDNPELYAKVWGEQRG